MTDDATSTTTQAFISDVEQAPSFWQQGALWTILASSDQTQGEFSVIEQLMPAASGPPPHVHERVCEAFYVLDGEIEFRLATGPLIATTGSFVSIPPGTPHAFKVRSQTARVLNFYTPGGFEDRLTYTATPATATTLPPDGAELEPDEEQQTAFARRLREVHNERWVDMPSTPKERDA
jgi:quercetin dioxygenase-like cupin family protein